MIKATHKTILAIKKEKQDLNDFILAIADPKYKTQHSLAIMIEQSFNKPNFTQVIFDGKGMIQVKSQSILQTIDVQCRQQNGKFIISKEEYYRIVTQITNDSQSEEESDLGQKHQKYSDGSEEQQSEIDAYQYDSMNKKRGRPKGSKNLKKNNQIDEYEYQEEEYYSDKKRGRGRPKGSKNKKNILKRSHNQNQFYDFKLMMQSHLISIKGATDIKTNLKIQSSQLTGKEEYSMWKRGKGRPKGSKNKVKSNISQLAQQQKSDETKQKRSRGRPKGVKNKPRSQLQKQMSQFNPNYHNLPNPQEMQLQQIQIICCKNCQQRRIKQLLLKAKNINEIKKILHQNQIYNIFKDISLENKTNIILKAIKSNQLQLVKLYFNLLNKAEPQYKSPWDVQNKFQYLNYTVKTKKDVLSRSGKQGIYVLLHDSQILKGQWWQIIKIQRVLESLSNNTNLEILELLKNYSPELKRALYQNIPTLIRCGNYNISKQLLKDIVPVAYNTYGYSKQHFECLQKENSQIQFKKINILKQNFSSNFCSPIHCAAINPNSQLLLYLLKNIHDYNVGDNLNRKPIHYASASQNIKNLEILLKFGGDLKDMDKLKVTPLMVAAYYGRVKNMELILNKINESTYLNFKSDEGFSALHYAILQNNIECVRLLLNNTQIQINSETKQKQTALHLVCGTGNIDIFNELLDAGAILDYYDKFQRTPLMFAIRNNNYNIFLQLIKRGVKFYKGDSSLNSTLHYAAAYGNIQVVKYLINVLKQSKNKRNYYPWQISVGKGHLGCAKLLENESKIEQGKFVFDKNNMLFLSLKSLHGTQQSIQMIKYLVESNKFDLNGLDQSGSNVFHYICNINEDGYIKARLKQYGDQSIDQQVFAQQYKKMQTQIILLFQKNNLDANVQNYKRHTPITLCIQNANIIGMKLLLTEKMNLDYESSKGYTIFHYLSKLASRGPEQMRFVYEKLKSMDKNNLKDNLKKIDSNGFEAILYFVKDFTMNVKENFKENVQKKKKIYLQSKPINYQITLPQIYQINKTSFLEFKQHEELFIKIISFMIQLGCDANVQVVDKPKDDESQNYKKWGIQHFLMKFPSLNLLSLFKNKIRDFNTQNFNGMTPLHLFCMWVKKGNLLQAEGDPQWYKDYTGEKSLQFLLQNGLNPNILDINRSTPLLYTALNRQISFIVLLRRFGSSINNCNNKNQVPFIEIIKMKNYFTFDEIESLLKIGADPNYQDLEKRNALHHLVYNSSNLDTSPQLCKILFQYGVKINSLDKYNRTPLFYCFTKIDLDQKENANQVTNDKVQILQTLINNKQINLDHVDFYHRTAIHYACQKNFFFSILYLLDKNINISIQDFEGNTPLAICLKHRNLNQAALLIKRGVKDGYVIVDEKKMSYFAYAMSKLSVGICYMLLDYGYPIEKALQQVTNEAFKKLLLKKYKNDS